MLLSHHGIMQHVGVPHDGSQALQPPVHAARTSEDVRLIGNSGTAEQTPTSGPGLMRTSGSQTRGVISSVPSAALPSASSLIDMAKSMTLTLELLDRRSNHLTSVYSRLQKQLREGVRQRRELRREIQQVDKLSMVRVQCTQCLRRASSYATAPNLADH